MPVQPTTVAGILSLLKALGETGASIASFN
jgi:hypothetical protein